MGEIERQKELGFNYGRTPNPQCSIFQKLRSGEMQTCGVIYEFVLLSVSPVQNFSDVLAQAQAHRLHDLGSCEQRRVFCLMEHWAFISVAAGRWTLRMSLWHWCCCDLNISFWRRVRSARLPMLRFRKISTPLLNMGSSGLILWANRCWDLHSYSIRKKRHT